MDQIILEHETKRPVKTVEIPPCPAILTRLIAEMRSDDPDFPKMAKLISADVALAATMLKTVNSPFYGLSQKVNSIAQALALLGLRNVSHLVTRLLLQQALAVGSNEAMEDYWDSSSKIAAILSWLARKTGKLDRDEAYTYGLFRDSGVPVMMLNFDDYVELAGDTAGNKERLLSEIEMDELGTDHATLGHTLAESWHLSQATCMAIKHHHHYASLDQGTDLPPQTVSMIALGVIAERLYCEHCGDPESAEWRRAGAAALIYSGINAEELKACEADINGLLATH